MEDRVVVDAERRSTHGRRKLVRWTGVWLVLVLVLHTPTVVESRHVEHRVVVMMCRAQRHGASGDLGDLGSFDFSDLRDFGGLCSFGGFFLCR